MADIFISYAREDRETAKTLAQALADQGWSVWWDRQIPSGRRFHEVIDRELTAARCVIALWSNAALRSLWVREEAQEGLDRDILVPAKIEAIRLPIGFRSIQTADLVGWVGDQAHPGFAQLMADITAALGEAAPRQQDAEPEAKPKKPVKRRAEPKANKPAEPRDQSADTVQTLTRPPWASAIGQDRYGSWVEIMVPPITETPVIQRLRWIEPGRFRMGSLETEPERDGDEGPQHLVTISRGFWLFDTACTQALWQTVMGNNPSHFTSPNRPVEQVSWNDVQDFLTRINERVPGLALDLPTEAQWEYACRAGTATPFSFGANITPEQVNYSGNYPYADGKTGQYRHETVPVASLPPNHWGLYEMHGNVWEWCADGLRHYEAKAETDPHGPLQSSADRVLRGGSWFSSARIVRSAYRGALEPGYRCDDIGFRCARVQS